MKNSIILLSCISETSVCLNISQAPTNDYNRLVSIPASTNSGVTTSGTDNPVDMFRNAVITLTTKGNVEEYIKPIVDILKRGVTDMAVLNEIIEVLYDHVSFINPFLHEYSC